ncbi:hypothetical protein [Candidatus Poriferisodalis sp.]|uniref:hypothetical protein n=1 Tax=Candidatus Poriferisodalis sp. TaxID=3101277 RepID=UPI003B5249B9
MTFPAPTTSTALRRPARRRLAAVTVAAVMLAAACSSTDDPDDSAPAATTPPATTAPAATPTTTEAPPTTTAPPDTAPATTAAPEDLSGDDDAEELAATRAAVVERRVLEELARAWPEPAETVEPSYDRRSPNGLLPDGAYFDHAAIRALFPACPPPDDDNWRSTWYGRLLFTVEEMAEIVGYWDRAYANWDTVISTYGGDPVGTGWRTDEQLAMVYTGGLITAANVSDYLFYETTNDTWSIGYDDVVTPETLNSEIPPSYGPYLWADGTYTMKSLYLRAAAVGYIADESQPEIADRQWAFVLDTGVPTDGQPNPQGVSVADLLAEWMISVYNLEPNKRGEPTAWAMRTLLDTRDLRCVVRAMRSVCGFGGSPDELAAIIGEQAADTLSGGHRFGALMRNLVCPQNT